jgi:hypothetical protein
MDFSFNVPTVGHKEHDEWTSATTTGRSIYRWAIAINLCKIASVLTMNATATALELPPDTSCTSAELSSCMTISSFKQKL